MELISLCPTEIRFMHSKINSTFRGGISVNDTVNQICEGKMSIHQLPKIKVVFRNDKYYAFDNRRLYVYRVLHLRGKLDKISVYLADESKFQLRRFTTTNDGSYVFMKRGLALPHTHATSVINRPKNKEVNLESGSSGTTSSNTSENSVSDFTANAGGGSFSGPEASVKGFSECSGTNEFSNGEGNLLSSNPPLVDTFKDSFAVSRTKDDFTAQSTEDSKKTNCSIGDIDELALTQTAGCVSEEENDLDVLPDARKNLSLNVEDCEGVAPTMKESCKKSVGLPNPLFVNKILSHEDVEKSTVLSNEKNIFATD